VARGSSPNRHRIHGSLRRREWALHIAALGGCRPSSFGRQHLVSPHGVLAEARRKSASFASDRAWSGREGRCRAASIAGAATRAWLFVKGRGCYSRPRSRRTTYGQPPCRRSRSPAPSWRWTAMR
jgi:hypothetical protein